MTTSTGRGTRPSTRAIPGQLAEARYGPHIAVRIALDGDTVRFEYRDDGPGYSEEVLQLERHNVGFDLMQKMVRKDLGGELSLHNDDGAVAEIRFKAQM
jgi:two-component sensor histidine kinase